MGCITPINKVSSNLFIGDHNAASNRRILDNYGITHIINCAHEIPNYFDSSIDKQPLKYHRLDLMDDKDDILPSVDAAYKSIISILSSDKNSKILVHCHMGKSRSASVVIYYLMKQLKLTYRQSLEKLKRSRSIVQPNPHYEMELLRFSQS